MKKVRLKAGSLIPRVVVMMAVSLICASVLMLIPANVYAEESSGDTSSNRPQHTVNHDDLPSVTLTDALTVTVSADGTTAPVTLNGTTVADALSVAGIKLNATDVCSPGADTKLVDGMRISVTRVTYEDKVTTKSIGYKTIRQNDSTLKKGVTRVEQYGSTGVRTIVTRITSVNGKVSDKQEISNEITKQPVDKIVKVGTKKTHGPYYGLKVNIVLPQKTTIDYARQKAYAGYGKVPATTSWRARISGNTITDQFGKQVKFQTMVSGKCTAYCETGSITSLGKSPTYGIVAVDPKVIPYGTKMFICSPDGSFVYGYAIAGDTGGAMRAGNALLDLHYNNNDQCFWFGRRLMNVYILE